MHHCGFPDFKLVGMYVVGLFFFTSGYGMEYKRVQNAISFRYILKRMTKLLTPLIFPAVVYLVMIYLIDGVNVLDYSINTLKSYQLILPYTWFVITLALLYWIYYIVVSVIPSIYMRSLIIQMFILLVITIISIVYLKFGLIATYHISNYGFLAGIIYRSYEDSIRARFSKMPYSLFVFIIAAICLYIAYHPFKGSIYTNVFILCMITVILYVKIPLVKSKVIDFISKISYEMYVCQGIAIYLFGKIGIDNVWFYNFIAVMLTMFIAFVCCNMKDVVMCSRASKHT